MGRKQQLPLKTRSQVLILREEGYSIREIAQRVACSSAAVGKVIQRFRNSGSYEIQRRSGRPRKSTESDDALLKRVVLKNPAVTSTDLRKNNPFLQKLSERTIRHRLQKELKMHTRKIGKRPLLTNAMRLKRLNWCKSHQHWSVEQWKKVMFSDESTFLQFLCYKSFIRRAAGTSRVEPRYCQPTVRYPPSVMVWACFSSEGRSGLYFLEKGATMNGTRYLEVLENHLINFMAIHRCTIFQHDSALCHKSKQVTKWLQEKRVQVLDWPGNSPDINPIKKLWILVKKKVSERSPQNIDVLKKRYNDSVVPGNNARAVQSSG